jgi:hypothetical protein
MYVRRMTADLQALRDELAALRSHVSRLEAELAAHRSTPLEGSDTAAERPTSRRQMLRIAAGTATGAVAAGLLARGTPAAASDSQQVVIGVANPGESTTRFEYGDGSVGGLTGSQSLIEIDATTNGAPLGLDGLRSLAASGTAVYGEADGDGGGGVAGFANNSSGLGVSGRANGGLGIGVYAFNSAGRALFAEASAGVGGQFKGGAAALQLLIGNATPPPARGGTYDVGTIDIDDFGDVWLCVAAGTPGAWRKLSGLGTAGALHAIDPVRVFDSRAQVFGAAPFGPNSSRIVSVADGRNAAGAVTAANAVPVGATAVAFNVTVSAPDGPNYLAVTSGDASGFSTSTINFPGGFDAANGSIVRLDGARQIRIFCGDQPGSTHVIVDVVGYYR